MTAEAVRDAVARGDYAAATRCFDEYARALPVDGDSLREFAALLEWTRATVLCASAHAADRLQKMRAEAQAIAAYRR